MNELSDIIVTDANKYYMDGFIMTGEGVSGGGQVPNVTLLNQD